MRNVLRPLRGAVGMGLTWAVAWFGVGLVFGVVGFQAGASAFGSGLGWLAYNSLVSAIGGFIGGAAFSVVLGVTEGRRRFDEMSLLRFAIWGGLGGLVVAGLQVVLFSMVVSGTPDFLYYFGLQGLMGAGSATGTLMLARKADGPALLPDGLDVDEVGLTAEEKRQLLGS